MSDRRYLSAEFIKKLKKELVFLETKKLPEIGKKIGECVEYGDLPENAEYDTIKEIQKLTIERVKTIKELIASAAEKEIFQNKVSIGSKMIVSANGREFTITIVDPEESTPEEGFISHESPIGTALMEKEVNEIVEISTPKGMIIYKIISIQ